MVAASVIIPTFNEERHIKACIESLLKQDLKDMEIIVVDNGSKDRTTAIVEEYISKHPEKVKLIGLGKNYGPGGARNVGAEAARGDVLVFLDADMVFPPEYVGKLVEPILNQELVSTVHGEELVANTDNPWVKVQGQARKPRQARIGEAFRAIRRDVFLKHGGFDPSLHYHDDRTFYHKTGVKAVVVEDATCFHNNPDTVKELFRRNYWIGRTFIAVMLYEKGLAGLAAVAGTVVIRLVDVLALPLFLVWLALPASALNNLLLDVVLIIPALLFIFLTAKMRILRGLSFAENIALRVLYSPAYRVLRAAGLLAGLLVSLTTGLRRRVPPIKQPPSRARPA